jgi:Gpi18-like mannosyltransferase
LFEGKKIYIASFAALFAVEAVLSLYTGLPYDMKVWFQTGIWMNQGTNIYLPNDHLGYPPLWALWCWVSYNVYSFFGNNLEIWRFVLKLPLIVAHLVLAYVVGKFAARNFGDTTGRRVFFTLLAWAFIIYIGAWWGQINTLSALLTYLAFEAMVNQRTTKSAVLLGIAVALKIYPLVVLPAFLVYALMKRGRKDAAKVAFWVLAIPVVFTTAIFAIFRWDLLYFLKTIFYWTPIFETSQVQIQGGCMNLWSFLALFKIDAGSLWYLRVLWVPVLFGGFALFWLRRRSWETSDFNLALITLYSLFMMSYGWVTEQSFIDLLPFLFLQIMCFRPKKSQFYLLVVLQVLIFAFSAVDYGEFIFLPFIERFSPSLLPSLQVFIPTVGSTVWAIRGLLGLVVTVYLGLFLLLLVRTSHDAPKPGQDHPVGKILEAKI